MLFTEKQLKSVLYGRNTIQEVATDYFDENLESILEVHSYFTGYVEVVEELGKQVKEYKHFKYAKEKSSDHLKVIKESVKLSEGFKDLQSVYNSIQHFKGRNVYIGLLNMLNDDIIDYAENIISFYGNTLESCIKYRDSFNSYYYTFFIEGIEIDDEDILCYTIDLVRALLDD